MAKKKLILFFALTAVLLLIFFPGFYEYQKLASRERTLLRRIGELEKTNRRLEDEIYRLKNDMEYVERIAREKLGVVKEDEIPYKIEDEEGGEE